MEVLSMVHRGCDFYHSCTADTDVSTVSRSQGCGRHCNRMGRLGHEGTKFIRALWAGWVVSNRLMCVHVCVTRKSLGQNRAATASVQLGGQLYTGDIQRATG